MSTWYVDKRNTYNGDGSTPDAATSDGGVGAFNTIDGSVLWSGNTGVDPTINFVEGSGPYYTSDCTWSLFPGKAQWYHESGGTVIVNGNNNIFDAEIELIDNTKYLWHESSVSGLYYLTDLAGNDPGFSGVGKSCVVDGVWDAEATSLFGAEPSATPTHNKKWGWGDQDSLGFDTFYVRGINPVTDDVSVKANISDSYIYFVNERPNSANYIFNDLVLKGGGNYNILSSEQTALLTFNRCTFSNSDEAATYFYGPATYTRCLFINSGHQAFVCNFKDQTAINCTFINTHTVAKLSNSSDSITVTVKNCATYNMLAGIFQHDIAANVLVENNNQFHLDPDSGHGGQALAFTTGTRQWTTTNSTDLPASESTTNTTSVDPKLTAAYKLKNSSPCIDAGVVISGITDGYKGAAPDIGWKEYRRKMGGLSLGLNLGL